ncbi:hypothetical protein WQ54_03650 [Bacillus sp. SA1-12]|uniref:hypothetical protein n=1 Tax=Bacillus sp. SA1-12 TaxID=1455638 RepID=UPI000626E040|nr:hypothetical protein [Bacillus sp. SA1-12]KKI93344.1 hypothetical protein WQ54_03650 [Bacillus sp. SA1-12]
MKIKVIMNSGKEYVVVEENYSVNDFKKTLYNDRPEGRELFNGFIYLDHAKKITINPTHISSIEVLQE